MTLEQAAQDLLETLHNMLYTNSFGGFQCTRDDAGDIEAAIGALGKALAQPVTQAVPQIPQEHSSNRTWVGLTDEEQQQAYEQCQNDGWGVFYNAIEAKLKEKNT